LRLKQLIESINHQIAGERQERQAEKPAAFPVARGSPYSMPYAGIIAPKEGRLGRERLGGVERVEVFAIGPAVFVNDGGPAVAFALGMAGFIEERPGTSCARTRASTATSAANHDRMNRIYRISKSVRTGAAESALSSSCPSC
jgi:hypothetical protein